MSNNLNILGSRKALITALAVARIAGLTSLILGHPGIGKTEILDKVVSMVDVTPTGMVVPKEYDPKVVSFYGSQHEGTDISGYPVLSTDGESLSFKVMQKLQALVSGDTLLVDELTLADEGTLKPLLQLLSGRRPCVNDWVGPEHVTRVGIGNLADSGNLDFLESPVLNNRCAKFEWLGPTVEEWIEYALSQAIHPAIVAAIKMEGHTLMLDWDPSRDRNPTPRAWFNASRQLYAAEAYLPEGVPTDLRLSTIASCVGDPAALTVETILTLRDKLVPFKNIVAAPGSAPVPDGITDPAAQFLVAAHVANKTVPDNWAKVTQYIERFPIELQATMVSPIVERHPVLVSTTEYQNYLGRTRNLH